MSTAGLQSQSKSRKVVSEYKRTTLPTVTRWSVMARELTGASRWQERQSQARSTSPTVYHDALSAPDTHAAEAPADRFTIVFTVRRYAIAVYAMGMCLCLRLCLCLSVCHKSEFCTKTAKCSITETTSHDSPYTL